MSAEAQPRVFLVILNWNGYEVTRDCLLSLRQSDYLAAHIVLVDNASSDGSAEKLTQEFPEITLIRNRENLGFTGGNNVGIRHALERGANYLLLLNNDTVVAPDFLSQLIRVGESDAGIGLLNPKILYHDSPDRIWYAGGSISLWRGLAQHWSEGARDSGLETRPREVTFITGCAFLIKAEVVRRIGLLDESYFYTCEDTDWSIRARAAGYRAVYVPGSVIWHKVSFDIKRNAGKPFRDFYNIRNSILLARKHARFYHWPTFLVSLGLMVGYRAAGYAARREFDRVRALFQGVRAGLGPLTIVHRYSAR